MASDPTSIRMGDELSERFEEFRSEHQYEKAEAMRRAIDEGLQSMGYEPSYRNAADKLLYFVRRMASVFGLAALGLLGVGVFTGPVPSRMGFGMAVISIALFAGAEIADAHGARIKSWTMQRVRNEAKQWTGGE